MLVVLRPHVSVSHDRFCVYVEMFAERAARLVTHALVAEISKLSGVSASMRIT
jgi:hypothetical protein